MSQDGSRRGYLAGLAAYAMWGFFPIYFHALKPAGALEILAQRIFWSVVTVAIVITAIRRWDAIRALLRRPKAIAGIAGAALLIAGNWCTYIYGVNSGHVVETSLGYFINPLISVLFGVLVFRERLRGAQWVALGLGAVAVAVIAVDYGRLPWIALTLAISFGSYGLLKKTLGLPPTDGLLMEAAVLTLPAIAYLSWLQAAGRSTFVAESAWHTVLLVLTGLATAVPLLMFADAANRIPISHLGMIQYVAPVLQLLCGLVVFHEPMPPAQLAGFVLVWAAIIVFTWDALRHARRAPAPRVPAKEPATLTTADA